MTAPLIFLDLECTGLSYDDDIWEIGAIRREIGGSELSLQVFVEHDLEKASRLPASFRADHDERYDPAHAVPRESVGAMMKSLFHTMLGGPAHVVGAVPSFDTERLGRLMGIDGGQEPWHYHLIDVENLAVGYLAAMRVAVNVTGYNGPLFDVTPPWDSKELSRRIGVDPAQFAEHTALGDAQWARAIYDQVMGL